VDAKGLKGIAQASVDSLCRHLEDLRTDSYEGAVGSEREARYRVAFDLLSPIAIGVLGHLNEHLLGGAGDVSIRAPEPDGRGGLIGSWVLSWPELRRARNRMTSQPLSPVTISAVWPSGFVHPHLVPGGTVDPRAESLTAWPMQIRSPDEAARQEPLLWAIAEAEAHDRIYQSSWRIMPRP
jgi:hypothetical protein